MSENKRSRKYSTLKETKQRTLFLRKDDADSATATGTSSESGPRILLKPNKPADKSPPSAAPAISIATREVPLALPGSNVGSRTPPQSASSLLAAATSALAAIRIPSSTAATATTVAAATMRPPPTNARNASPSLQSPNEPASSAQPSHFTPAREPRPTADPTTQPPMASAQPLISDNFLLDPAAFAHLHDTNTQFFVVGCIGTRGTGKSTVLNLLQTDDFSRLNSPDYLQQAAGAAGCFAVRRPVAATAAAQNLAAPTTEGVQMFITADRLVLLDSVPVLCNPWRKDAAAAEQDDLRLIAFMLNVCQLVLVVDGGGANVQLLRLLQMAELMKPASKYRDGAAPMVMNPGQAQAQAQTGSRWLPEHQHLPSVWFVHNFADHWRCGEEQRWRTERLYVACFRQSQLAMFGGNRAARGVCAEMDRKRAEMIAEGAEIRVEDWALPADKRLNWTVFPRVTGKFNGHAMDLTQMVQEFRRQVLLAPRVHFACAGGLTERGWAEAAQRLWDSHKSGSYAMKCEGKADGERAKNGDSG